MHRALVVIACSLAITRPADAQRFIDSPWSDCRRVNAVDVVGRDVPASPRCGAHQVKDFAMSNDATITGKPRSAWSILASAVLPGSGQAMLRQWRAVPYVALEGYAWSTYAGDSRKARRDRDAYRLLAATVARSVYTGFKPNGDFEYYERMENFLESGKYDLDPSSAIEPEGDTTTFNGSVWLLARRTYWKDIDNRPSRDSREWVNAERFYLNRAIRPEYQWSWRGATTQLEQYRRYIRQANQGYRDAVTDLGIVIGNHFLSTVDAYVTVQVRRRKTLAGRGYEVSFGIPF
jgi:hypothetical protein